MMVKCQKMLAETRLFLVSIKVEFGFGYVFAQCVFKACLDSQGGAVYDVYGGPKS